MAFLVPPGNGLHYHNPGVDSEPKSGGRLAVYETGMIDRSLNSKENHVKGMFFQKPVEFGLIVSGESWLQGEPIAGELTIKNHGPTPLDLADVGVHLAEGTLSKVRKKAEGAFDVTASKAFADQGEVAPAAQVTLPWKFETDLNTPITDSSSSLFLLYGKGSAGVSLGQLQISMNPVPVIEEFIKILTIHLRFVVKSRKAGKNGVVIKLAPPDSKSFSTLELLAMTFSFDGDTLNVDYSFWIKAIKAGPIGGEVKKDRVETTQVFTKDQYLRPSGRLAHETLEAGIREAVAMVEQKGAF